MVQRPFWRKICHRQIEDNAVAPSRDAHLSDDETVAKMGHPDLMVTLGIIGKMGVFGSDDHVRAGRCVVVDDAGCSGADGVWAGRLYAAGARG